MPLHEFERRSVVRAGGRGQRASVTNRSLEHLKGRAKGSRMNYILMLAMKFVFDSESNERLIVPTVKILGPFMVFNKVASGVAGQ